MLENKWKRLEKWYAPEVWQRGYLQGFDEGYQEALDDMRRRLREKRKEKAELQWENIRNGEVCFIPAEKVEYHAQICTETEDD